MLTSFGAWELGKFSSRREPRLDLWFRKLAMQVLRKKRTRSLAGETEGGRNSPQVGERVHKRDDESALRQRQWKWWREEGTETYSQGSVNCRVSFSPVSPHRGLRAVLAEAKMGGSSVFFGLIDTCPRLCSTTNQQSPFSSFSHWLSSLPSFCRLFHPSAENPSHLVHWLPETFVWHPPFCGRDKLLDYQTVCIRSFRVKEKLLSVVFKAPWDVDIFCPVTSSPTGSLHSPCTRPLAEPWTNQTYPHLRALALAVPCQWKALPQHHFPNVIFSVRPSLTTWFKIEPFLLRLHQFPFSALVSSIKNITINHVIYFIFFFNLCLSLQGKPH